MATLAQWLSDLASRIGAEIKALRAELNNRISKLYPTVEGGLTISNPNEWETSDLDFTNFNDFRTAHFRTYYEPGYSEFIMAMKSPVGPGYTTNVLKVEGETGVFDFRHRPMWKATVNGSPVAATPWDSVNFKPADYALIASPAFNGIPTAPTATAGTNTTQIATTAFVTAADNLKANLASPAFTGNPTAPTQTAGNNSTRIATTAFVTTGLNLKANLSGAAFTGAISAPNHLTTMSGFCSGKPSASEIVAGQIFPVATTISAANCNAQSTVAATAQTVFTVKNKSTGLTVMTFTFNIGATNATVSTMNTSVSAFNYLYIEAPATPDATLANLSFLVRA